MADLLSDDDMREIQERCDKVPEGPWEMLCKSHERGQKPFEGVADDRVLCYFGLPTQDGRCVRLFVAAPKATEAECSDMGPNADFIAHARQDIPKLLAHIEATDALHREQAAEIERLRAEVQDIRRQNEWADSELRQSWNEAKAQLHAIQHPPVLDKPDCEGPWVAYTSGRPHFAEVQRWGWGLAVPLSVWIDGKMVPYDSWQRITLPTPAPQQPPEKPARIDQQRLSAILGSEIAGTVQPGRGQIESVGDVQRFVDETRAPKQNGGWVIMREKLDQALIDAANLLADYARQLPEGYEIELSMTSEEQCLSLFDPDGNEVEVYSDGDSSAMRDAVEAAREHAAENGGG